MTRRVVVEGVLPKTLADALGGLFSESDQT